MTRKYFQRLFGLIYLCSLGLCAAIGLVCEYLIRPDGNDCPLLALRDWRALAVNDGGLVLLLPVVLTCVIGGLVRLTNKTEPLSDEERHRSFTERLSKTQLFLPLSLLLLLPFIRQVYVTQMFTPVWVFYAFMALHLVAAWLLVLFLRRIARIRRIGWKIVSILLFLLAGIVYITAATTALYECSYADRDRGICSESSDNPEDAISGDAAADFARIPQEALAGDMIRDALATYDHYQGDPDMLIGAAGQILRYDPDRIYSNLSMSAEPMTREEIDRQSEESRRNFDRMQQLGRYLEWLRNDVDESGLETMTGLMGKALRSQSERYDYAAFAKRIDMLDVAYLDLLEQGGELYEYDLEYFGEIYRYASETPLQWENYTRYISNPYIRYTVEGNDGDEALLLWAYTFWGRRYDEGNWWICRKLLDEILETYPNTHYSRQTVEKQNALMRDAEARVAEFFKWYKANYWSFRELKAARYDDKGNLGKFDPDEYAKYLHALEKSGYLAPRLLRRLSTVSEGMADSLKTGNVREKEGEWLRTDPLLSDYEALAGEIDDMNFRTDRIEKPGQRMRIAASTGNLQADVECIDGKWFVSDIGSVSE